MELRQRSYTFDHTQPHHTQPPRRCINEWVNGAQAKKVNVRPYIGYKQMCKLMGGWSSGKKNWTGLNTHEMRCANGRKESEERRKKYDERLVWRGIASDTYRNSA